MAGAGGGGFIFVLTKEPNMVDEVKDAVTKMAVGFRCPTWARSVLKTLNLLHACVLERFSFVRTGRPYPSVCK